MVANTSSSTSSNKSFSPLQNHRQPAIVRALQWFWRFSQFYGEYTVRSPQERQRWIKDQTG
ncbi:MAG: hypothetical protein WBA76_01365 [Phormidesmis sp.]